MKNYINVIKLCISQSPLVLIVPILFIALLFIGSKFCKKGEWNDEFLSIKQTQVIRGFCAIGIVIHHCAQETAAPWLKAKLIIHGLDFFVDIGYLFVAIFLFISGYGLYKSYKSKENYFDDYFSKRILPIIIAYITTSLIYYLYYPTSSTYTWYLVAVTLCYALFYLGFKYIKKEYISFAIVIFGLFIYAGVCDFFKLGGWWFNTIGLFVIGLLFAKFESYIVSFFKKTYIPLLIIVIILTIVCRYYGRYYETAIYSATKESQYYLYSALIILYRFAASICFTFTLVLLSLKCKFNNRVLKFYGAMSLEFYLIQGLFVQMFSYSYFDIYKSKLYIDNVPLYLIVVFVCSTAAGFLLHYIDGKIKDFLLYFYEGRRAEIKYVLKALKTGLIIVICAFLAYVTVFGAVSIKENKDAEKYVEAYKEKFITFADVGGKKMAAYIVGQGKETLVLMRGNDDPCPTLSMRKLADKLAEEHRVVVLDYLGTGFSDKPSSQRTSKNIAYEIHEALHNLGIEKNYILMPAYISGYYAQQYCKMYKDEVKAVIGLETEVAYEFKTVMDDSKTSPLEYYDYVKKDSIIKFIYGRLASLKGVDYLLWHVVEDGFFLDMNEEEMIVAKNIFFKNIYNSTYVNEKKNEYSNYKNSFSTQYPRKIYVVDLLDNSESLAISGIGHKSDELHAEACFERAKHKSFILADLPRSIFYAPGIIVKVVGKSMEFIK